MQRTVIGCGEHLGMSHFPVLGSAARSVLDGLDEEQRAAATLPDGPAQIIAPAGSGKTTTLVARLAVLLSRGVPADRICVVTFNRDAAKDLSTRVRARLGEAASGLEIRTLHALARQVLLQSGEMTASTVLVSDRLPLVRAARRAATAATGVLPPEVDRLDSIISAATIEARSPPAEAEAAVQAYHAMLRARGAVDFDELVARAADVLATSPGARAAWQMRFSHLCVDEFQDVDAAQLRLVRLLAAPQDNLFVVGDDDQTIYAWRLADVRRILRFETDYPGTHRVTLATNYRCPAVVVDASARMIAHNRERFDKPIRPPPSAARAPDSLLAASTAGDGWEDALGGLAAEARARHTLCFLARTRAELTPIMLALVRAGVPHRSAWPPLVESARVQRLLADARSSGSGGPPFRALLAARRRHGWSRGDDRSDELGDDDHAALDAVLGWSTAYPDLGAFLAALESARARLARLSDEGSTVELATVHSAKGREWATVVLVGFEADRMPNRRSLAANEDLARALEEERRLAYVALTRATRRLVLAFDPARPSPFLAEMGYAV